jgi:hypothetical protein
MVYRIATPRLTAKESRQETALQRRSDLASQLKLSRPNHIWTPNPKNKVYCYKCGTKSPFRMDMARHLYIVKEWP